MQPKDIQAVQEFRERVSKLLGLRLVKLALFGSKAENRDTPESDIDLLVLIDDSAWESRDEILDLAFEINLKHGIYISPRIITLSTYHHPVWRLSPFIQQLRTKSIRV